MTRAEQHDLSAQGHPHLVLDGDYSDPDVIRVGDTYWMITSTIHCSPGMAVLRSPDLRSWRHVGHCIPDLRVLGPAYEHVTMGSRFGRGVYAGSLRFHDGRFWMHFTTLDEGIFVTTAKDPAGPWTRPRCLSTEPMWDDPCPLWDDDGRAWLVASNPGPSRWFSYLIPMAWDGLSIDLDRRVVLDDRHTSEGNKVYVHEGRYYVLHNEVHSHGDRLAVILRSERIEGPWEKRVLLRGLGPDRAREPNQGALVERPDGSWVFVTQHGRGGYPDGRPVSVLPVAWEDGWPVVWGAEGPGLLRWEVSVRADVGSIPGLEGLQRDDDFSTDRLGPQWEWTNAPLDDHWSLTSRPGWLRLHAAPSARGDGLVTAANLLSQRISARPGVTSVLLDATGLAEGASAGLCHYSTRRPVGIGVHRQDGRLRIGITDGAETAYGDQVPVEVQLRSDVDERDYATFSYRAVGEAFVPLGDSYRLEWSSYRGSRIGLFALSQRVDAGLADFSAFRYGVTQKG